MLVDADLLLYAVAAESPHHDAAARWWTGVLDGHRRVGIPWQSIGAFVRIVTHPRVTTNPLSGDQAWSHGVTDLGCNRSLGERGATPAVQCRPARAAGPW